LQFCEDTCTSNPETPSAESAYICVRQTLHRPRDVVTSGSWNPAAVGKPNGNLALATSCPPGTSSRRAAPRRRTTHHRPPVSGWAGPDHEQGLGRHRATLIRTCSNRPKKKIRRVRGSQCQIGGRFRFELTLASVLETLPLAGLMLAIIHAPAVLLGVQRRHQLDPPTDSHRAGS
jgi:hypothetical protein